MFSVEDRSEKGIDQGPTNQPWHQLGDPQLQPKEERVSDGGDLGTVENAEPCGQPNFRCMYIHENDKIPRNWREFNQGKSNQIKVDGDHLETNPGSRQAAQEEVQGHHLSLPDQVCAVHNHNEAMARTPTRN